MLHWPEIPEMRALESGLDLVRIPESLDVPLTSRVRRLIDQPAFQRLRRVSQLGLVGLVYPGATHSRFEHSLGVYRNALLFLQQLGHEPRFREEVSESLATAFLAAALLHDIGHWPYCHPIEDLELPGIEEHETLAARFLLEPPLRDLLRVDWGLDVEQLLRLLQGDAESVGERLLQSLLSGPIDIDKLDYLYRDSLHAGVPYGHQFDRHRLIGSLCLNQAGDGLAITEKGKTAAELMVFARYVMFSEVYWHHTVRSGTAMLQRGFFLLRQRFEDAWEAGEASLTGQLMNCSEHEFQQLALQWAGGTPAAPLIEGIFSDQRQLYKQIAEYSYFDSPELYAQVARRPYAWLVGCAEQLAQQLSQICGGPVQPEEVVIDAPPVGLEVQFQVDVFDRHRESYRPLGDVSPVVQALAKQQFDDFVKRVRILLHPRVVGQLPRRRAVDRWMKEAIAATPAAKTHRAMSDEEIR